MSLKSRSRQHPGRQRQGGLAHQPSRHFQVGKDYAHAAHASLVAHGHAMKALIDRGKAGVGPTGPASAPRVLGTLKLPTS